MNNDEYKINDAVNYLEKIIVEMVVSRKPYNVQHSGLMDPALALIALVFKREMDRHAEEDAASNIEVKDVN